MMRSLYRILAPVGTVPTPQANKRAEPDRSRTPATDAGELDVARIPAGEFLMGAADGEGDERPVHRVFVSEVFIRPHPVTNDGYGRFLRATAYSPPSIGLLPVLFTG